MLGPHFLDVEEAVEVGIVLAQCVEEKRVGLDVEEFFGAEPLQHAGDLGVAEDLLVHRHVVFGHVDV